MWPSVLIMLPSFLLFIALGVPLMRRRVPPNRIYGLRIPSTFHDEVVWYEANARSGRHFVQIGSAGAALTLLLPIVPGMHGALYLGFTLSFMMVTLAWTLFIDVRFANRLRDSRRDKETPS